MITPDHLRTAQQILHRAGLDVGDGRRTAAALIAVHLANLPPEPEMWGATPEPMSSEDHMREAVLSACRVVKAVGWVPDAMTVAILATAEVGSAYAAWTRPYVWVAQMDRTPRHPSAEELRDLAGVATVATDEPEAAPVVHTHECYTRSAMAEHWQCDCSGTLAVYSNTGEPVDPAIYAAAMAPILDEVERVASETPPIVVEVPPEHAMSVAVEEFPTAAESRGIANALIDVIFDSHGLERGPDGVVRKKATAVDTTVPDETLNDSIEVDDLDHHTSRVVWQIGDKAGVGPWTTPEEAMRAALAGNAEHGPDTHRVDVDRRVVEKYDEREGWYAVSFDDLRAGDAFRMRERTATEDGPPEIAGCDAYQNERGIWTITARPMTPIDEDPERVEVDSHGLVDLLVGGRVVEVPPEHAMSTEWRTLPVEPIVGVVLLSVQDPDFSPTGPAADEPKPKKPRCGLGYGWYETEPARPMLCGRPEGHKGACGPAKVVGKAKGGES